MTAVNYFVVGKGDLMYMAYYLSTTSLTHTHTHTAWGP